VFFVSRQQLLRRLKRLLLVLYLLHNPQGCGECREMTGSFPVRAVVRGENFLAIA